MVHRVVRLAVYLALALVAVTVVAAIVAVVSGFDVVATISVGLVGTGAALGAAGVVSSAGRPPPDIPGLEREYVRHVHHRDAAERRAWQDDSLLLVLAGVALAAVGAAIGLLA